MSDAPAVLAAIVAVNKAIAAAGIAKGDRNAQQNFTFRGVDRVYEAMAGPMAEHGLFSTSKILSSERAERQSKGGGALMLVYLTVEYTFWCASDGSAVSTEVVAEAMDSGDKATAKAMSVAHRTALLQLSTAPVNPAEPDAESYEVAPKAEGFMGFESEVAAKAAHEEFSKDWLKLPPALRPELPEDWPVTKYRLDVLSAQVGALLSRPFDDVPPGPPQNTSLPLDTAPV